MSKEVQTEFDVFDHIKKTPSPTPKFPPAPQDIAAADAEVLNYNESRKFFAGCALMGFCSEIRLGKNVQDTDLRKMVETAAKLGEMMADRME